MAGADKPSAKESPLVQRRQLAPVAAEESEVKRNASTAKQAHGNKAHLPDEVVHAWFEAALGGEAAAHHQGVSKEQLLHLGLRPTDITRAHRALYVHSCGVEHELSSCVASLSGATRRVALSRLLTAFASVSHKAFRSELSTLMQSTEGTQEPKNNDGMQHDIDATTTTSPNDAAATRDTAHVPQENDASNMTSSVHVSLTSTHASSPRDDAQRSTQESSHTEEDERAHLRSLLHQRESELQHERERTKELTMAQQAADESQRMAKKRLALEMERREAAEGEAARLSTNVYNGKASVSQAGNDEADMASLDSDSDGAEVLRLRSRLSSLESERDTLQARVAEFERREAQVDERSRLTTSEQAQAVRAAEREAQARHEDGKRLNEALQLQQEAEKRENMLKEQVVQLESLLSRERSAREDAEMRHHRLQERIQKEEEEQNRSFGQKRFAALEREMHDLQAQLERKRQKKRAHKHAHSNTQAEKARFEAALNQMRSQHDELLKQNAETRKQQYTMQQRAEEQHDAVIRMGIALAAIRQSAHKESIARHKWRAEVESLRQQRYHLSTVVSQQSKDLAVKSKR